MSRIFWSNTYSVGHPDIDSEHKKLVEIYNRIVDAVESFNDEPEDRQELMTLLVIFKQNIKRHFFTEESVLSRLNYPDLPNHQLLHFDSLGKISSIDVHGISKKEYRKMILETVGEWWVNHLLIEDMKFKDFILKNL
ncbi:MAG: hypothetical protein HON68_08250 [Gammaproteobacteria bacterium]|jgi:hemerythrin-like metal-binding protein|nr:hypothetical protein [Gammaproteobacteria bacterium]MBT5465769.1 hypothetical protein [Candidatus Neomarinimicrobiota bacterium]MBT3489969.1 hypothetical protein [Gammaproteobacteria bacterium]MBT3719227.1 hypothetical protein [Gammaproteobacteria bacterium]MBT3844419.1 hypothetical protein [Gammaproteobacteria bacterium]